MEVKNIPYYTVENRKCRICGCTDEHSCVGGCFWIGLDLCSKCYLELKDLWINKNTKVTEKPSIAHELIKVLQIDGINSKKIAIQILKNIQEYEV